MMVLITLIAVLVALVVQRYGNVAGWFNATWFDKYLTWLRPFIAKATNKWFGFGVIIAPIFILLALLHLILMQGFFGLFYLIFSSLILLLCMDARDIKNQLANYFVSAEKNDVGGAVEAIRSSELVEQSTLLPESLPELNREVTKIIFFRHYEKVFGVLFWFSIANVYGAVFYTLLSLMKDRVENVDGSFKELAIVANFVQSILDWIPIRILNLIYALVGNFSQGFAFFKHKLNCGLNDNVKIVVDSGLAVLGVNIEHDSGTWSENKLAIELIDRVLIIWIVVLSLVTFGMLL